MDLDIGNVTARVAAATDASLLQSTKQVSERTMASVARGALFTEALLGAIKARVAEFKAVAK